MKGSGALFSSLIAASTVAFSSPGDLSEGSFSNNERGTGSRKSSDKDLPGKSTSSDKGKYALRFDGLRFLETLVTAHR
ncbi:uncharacterized protein LOC122081533 [Macadamia integrifolia]|uniref:uncharacterized protein LOC122081533 n=1 Tax=Macadamia integrifolia TaxID=60698 RepID=UPI001C4FE60D|nr:uncharacterized protein LOC122081533 [Macadamia integrifolia]